MYEKFSEGKIDLQSIELRVLICVAEDARKKVPSSVGMRRGVETSELLKFRAEEIVPRRADEMSAAIAERDFEKFAQITMKDSNQVRSKERNFRDWEHFSSLLILIKVDL